MKTFKIHDGKRYLEQGNLEVSGELTFTNIEAAQDFLSTLDEPDNYSIHVFIDGEFYTTIVFI
jgi:hypothetical protein